LPQKAVFDHNYEENDGLNSKKEEQDELADNCARTSATSASERSSKTDHHLVRSTETFIQPQRPIRA
jgi:hypothetical protein